MTALINISTWKFYLRSMRFQLTLMVFVLGALTIALSSYVIIREQLEQSYEHIHTEKQTIAMMAQGSINRAFRLNLPQVVNEVVAEINAHRGVSAAAIFDTNHERLPYGAPAISQRLEDSFPNANPATFDSVINSNRLRFEHNRELTRFLAYVPVTYVASGEARTQTHILVIEIFAPLTWQDAFYQRLPFLASWASALVLLMAFIMYILHSKVADPTQRLVANLIEVRKRNYEAVKSVRGFSEFEVLSDALIELVNQRKSNESQLLKLSAAVEQSNEGILITDMDANIEYANKALMDNTGYQWEEIQGKNPRIFASGNTPPETFTRMWKRLSAGMPWRGELYNRRKDGSEYIELQTVTPLKMSEGRSLIIWV